MRYSQYFIPTYKEIPSDAEVVSHQLLLRAGMIRKLAAGIYTYLPAGLRSIKKVENIIREEMNRAGAIELLMPAVQPGELWQESGRWDYYGRELLRFKDRHNRNSCFGPTHEEVITDLVRREIHSYKQMPVNFYQIQNKFRDEIRPRFGLMRCREFIMKDAYSFDADEEAANRSYEAMYAAYERIFQRCGLKFRAVEADSGAIGGSYSHEFMVLAETGEDQMVSCSACRYAANLEKAEVKSDGQPARAEHRDAPSLEEIETPDARTVEQLTACLKIRPDQLVKTLIFMADDLMVAALVRGDHELNEAKLRNLLGAEKVEMAGPELVAEATGAPMGFAGPVGLKIQVVADEAIKGMHDFVTGGNRKDLHLRNVNLNRDFKVKDFADLRMITPADPCPKCGRPIYFGRGIEVGHVFKLGAKYSQAMNALYLDPQGREKPIVMGCYGIGVGRTLAAAIEQNHDRNGIVFPVPVAPFEATILPLQMHAPDVVAAAERIYAEVSGRDCEVLLDDRNERAGVKFNDADLSGIPVCITVGSRGIRRGMVEIKLRASGESFDVPLNEASSKVKERIQELYDSLK